MQKVEIKEDDVPLSEEEEDEKGDDDVIQIELNSERVESHRVSEQANLKNESIESAEDEFPSPAKQRINQ